MVYLNRAFIYNSTIAENATMYKELHNNSYIICLATSLLELYFLFEIFFTWIPGFSIRV